MQGAYHVIHIIQQCRLANKGLVNLSGMRSLLPLRDANSVRQHKRTTCFQLLYASSRFGGVDYSTPFVYGATVALLAGFVSFPDYGSLATPMAVVAIEIVRIISTSHE